MTDIHQKRVRIAQETASRRHRYYDEAHDGPIYCEHYPSEQVVVVAQPGMAQSPPALMQSDCISAESQSMIVPPAAVQLSVRRVSEDGPVGVHVTDGHGRHTVRTAALENSERHQMGRSIDDPAGKKEFLPRR